MWQKKRKTRIRISEYIIVIAHSNGIFIRVVVAVFRQSR